MRFTTSLRLWVGAVAVSVCNAQISKPRAGDVLMPNQQFEVEWQTAGLQAPINIDLVPSGKTDLSVIAEKIAVQVDNVGRLNWNPSASITAFESFVIVITDSTQDVVVSEPFKITQLTQQPVVQTILGADPAQVEILTAAAGPPKVVYSGALPAEAIPAGVAEAEAAPTEPALVQPEESRNTISNGTAPGASPSRQRTGKSKKQPATPNEEAVPRNSSKPLTSIAEKNQTPTPIYSTIQSAPSAPASFPTLSATKNQTGVPGRGAEVTPTPIYSTIPDSGPAFPSLSVTKNQTAPANAEVTPTPIYSTLPDTPSKFPTLAPTNNQTAPSAEIQQPAKSKAPAATQPAVEAPANRTSITPEAPTTPSLPIVTLPVPKNSTIPASPPATSAPPVLPSAANPASNSSATPTGLPALPVTEPAAVAPVPIAAPSAPSNPPSDGTGTAVTKPEPQTSDPAAAPPSAASSSGALPYKGTLPADGGAVKSDVPASTTGGPTDTASGVSVTPVPSTTAGGGKESEKGGDKSGDESGGSGSGSGKGSGQDSDTESDSESGSGSGSGSGSSSISGSNTGVKQPSTSVSSTAAIVPTPQPQLGVGIGATPVVQIGPSITLPSSLWTSMILETAAGFAAPSGGSFAVATSPALLTVPNAGCRTTQGGGYVAAVLGAVTALLVVVM
ncbi:hypothetical protein CPAR01_09814 [Colletotrichum paranaense]|uniref:Yeast cell wall synthesis Kre9/Knh1-like N-terminal domain-containing protein n=1 Tax=Colletotrichum paranaense TaxID=1914294 RepID=A0ABQ9SHS6_9PEZI|nr:uncharacterized protein CPAR01_09814 [Colletotrichum paranaense]KAK1536272.1 hypothetical protein CPAR01_09814 [Colletotrichum paranaense]